METSRPRRARPRPTPVGWMVLLLAAVLYLAGTNLGSGWLVLTVSTMVGAVVADTVSAVRLRRSLQVEVAVEPHDAVPQLAVSVTAAGGPGRVLVDVPRLGRRMVLTRGTATVRSRRPLPVGPVGCVDVVLRCLGPLHLGMSETEEGLRSDHVVQPLALPAQARLRGALHFGEAGPSTPLGVSEVRGLRDHVTGDGLRAVHWRATARRGSLVVRDTATPSGEDLRLHVAAGPWTPPSLLLAGTLVASLAQSAAALGHRPAVAMDGQVRPWDPALRRGLATLPGLSGGPLRDLRPAPEDGPAGITLRPAGTSVLVEAGTTTTTLSDHEEVRRWLAGA